MEEIFENNELYEINFWQDLIKSDDWTYYTALLKGHKAHLEKQALLSLGYKKFDEAMCFNARAQECGILLTLSEGRLKELKDKQKEKENGN